MGRNRSTQPDNRPSDPQITVDERNHSLRGPPRDRHRQRNLVHKPQLQGVLQGLGHKAYLCHTTAPQSNRQAESTNKSVVNMLKNRLEGSHKKWAEELHGVLWAYRTTPKTATHETPYSLVYGSEAIIPTEMHVRTTVSGPPS